MNTLIPMNSSNETVTTFSFQDWRNNFLKSMLRAALIVGAIFLLSTYLTPTETFLRIIYSGLLALLLLANLLPMPYQVKSLLFVIMLLALGISGLLENGIRGDSRVFLVAFVVITGTLFGNRAGIIANGLSALIMGIIGWLILSGHITILTKNLDIGEIDTWVVAILENIGISALNSTGIAWLERDFSNVQDSILKVIDTLQQERKNLENRVKERTIVLEKKTIQLQAASLVARETAQLQDINILLSQTVKLISERFGFYHAGIFLLNNTGEYAVLQAASSSGGQRMIARGHRLAVGRQGIVGAAAFQNRPHIARDVDTDKAFMVNPDLPMTRSEAAIPLTARGRVIGVLDIQSTEQELFDQEDIGIMQTLADQIGLAIENARLLSESQNALQRLEAASRENTIQSWQDSIRNEKQSFRYTSVGLAPLPFKENSIPGVGIEPDTLSIPITLRGQPIGNITLKRKTGNTWGESDRSLAIEIANQVGLAVENARLLQDAQRMASREQQISAITSQIQQSTDLDTVLKNTVRELGAALSSPNTFIQIGLIQQGNKSSSEDQPNE